MRNPITEVPAADPKLAFAHFSGQFAFETDCWDTHETLRQPEPGFVLLDVRSPALYAKSHVPGAINLPHGKIIESIMRAYSDDTLFVCYCAGPHCNGAARACLRLAALGYRCKLMTGGITGWIDEGFALQIDEVAA